MIKKRGLLVLGCALLTLGASSCTVETPNTKPNDNIVDDGNDYEQSTPQVTETVYSVVGSKFADWDPAVSMTQCKFNKVSSKLYRFETTVEVGDEFKIISGGTWGDQYGVEDLDWEKSTEGVIGGKQEDYNEGKGNRSNFKIAKAGELTIELHPYYFIDHDYSNVITLTLK